MKIMHLLFATTLALAANSALADCSGENSDRHNNSRSNKIVAKQMLSTTGPAPILRSTHKGGATRASNRTN
ncbi:hypothetical protein OAQ84_01105 [Bdellovibrionales bacterium]|nr:hypothetical protein [Bdellovibrionales bacterium]